jgi:ABC-type bacteriocin/lantibiotic exporter with double-glycine peptidase domain
MFGRMVTTILLRKIVVGIILVLPAVRGMLLAADLPGVWLDVPFVKQEKDGCGAASIAMVMQYWQYQLGAAVSQDSDPIQIQHVLYSAKIHGIYASDMERYFREKGFRTFTIRGEWEDLKQHLDKGRPLIVALKPAGGGAPLHYVVVTGLDQEQGIVMVNDPAQRKLLKQDRSAFEQEWSAAEKWTLLAMPQTHSR